MVSYFGTLFKCQFSVPSDGTSQALWHHPQPSTSALPDSFPHWLLLLCICSFHPYVPSYLALLPLLTSLLPRVLVIGDFTQVSSELHTLPIWRTSLLAHDRNAPQAGCFQSTFSLFLKVSSFHLQSQQITSPFTKFPGRNLGVSLITCQSPVFVDS